MSKSYSKMLNFFLSKAKTCSSPLLGSSSDVRYGGFLMHDSSVLIIQTGDEVKYFWLRPKNLISYLFLANRYVALISTITFTTLQTYADLSASVRH